MGVRYGISVWIWMLAVAYGQAPPLLNRWQDADRGVKPSGTYTLSDIESINMVNGNVGLAIPIAALPATSGGVTAQVTAFYNSLFYETQYVPFENPHQQGQILIGARPSPWAQAGGWRIGFDYGLISEMRPNNTGSSCLAPDRYPFRTKLRMPDGSYKILQPYKTSNEVDFDGYSEFEPNGSAKVGCNNTSLTGTVKWFTTDGSYIRVEMGAGAGAGAWLSQTWTAFFPDGTRVQGKADATDWIIDRHGNVLTLTRAVEVDPGGATSTAVVTILDNHSRSITMRLGVQETPRTVVDTVAWTAYGGPATASIIWQPHFADFEFTKYEQDISIGPESFSANIPGVSSIQLPPSKAGSVAAQYTFDYWGMLGADAMKSGELKNISTPDGLAIKYAYAAPQSRLMNPYRNPIASREIRYTSAPEPEQVETTNYQFQTEWSTATRVETGAQTRYDFYDPYLPSQWYRGLVRKITQPDGSIVERQWARNAPPKVANTDPGNPYVYSELSRPTAGIWSAKLYSIDRNGNNRKTQETSWNSGEPARSSTASGQPPGTLGWISTPETQVAREVLTSYYAETEADDHLTDSAAVPAQGSDPDCQSSPTYCSYYYWKASQTFPNPVIYLRSPKSRELKGRDGLGNAALITLAKSSFVYDKPTGPANLKEERHWDNTRSGSFAALDDSNSVRIAREYDTANRLVTVTDPRGIVTSNEYNGNEPYPKKRVQADGRAEKRTFSYAFNIATGLLNSEKDEDNGVTIGYTYDQWGRATRVEESGPGISRQTRMEYGENNRSVKTCRDRTANGESNDVAACQISRLDALGRPVETEVPITAGVSIRGTRRYKVNGGQARELVASPRTGAAAGEEGWTQTSFDSMGRTVAVEYFQGLKEPDGWFTTAPTGTPPSASLGTTSFTHSYVIDPVLGPQRKVVQTDPVTDGWNFTSETVQGYTTVTPTRTTYFDALGRLVRADHGGEALTAGAPAAASYSYNGRDELVRVVQGGTQGQRDFVYSSLGRLVSSTQPETGLQTFEYDLGGNLTLRHGPADAAGTFAQTRWAPYDGLNRPTSKSLIFTSPAASYVAAAYTYDVSGWKGALSSVVGPDASVDYRYDALGRTSRRVQTTNYSVGPVGASVVNRIVHSVGYGYDLADNLTSQVLPSGRVINITRDRLGRPGTIVGQLGTAPAKTYANVTAYSAVGGASSITLGNGRLESRNYNWQGQLAGVGWNTPGIDAVSLSWIWSPTGNLAAAQIVAGSTAFIQQYAYTSAGALRRVNDSILGGAAQNTEVYGYDAYGNRMVNWTSLQPQPNRPTAFNTRNQPSNGFFRFDAGGRMTRDGMNLEYQYDAEGKLIYVYQGSGAQRVNRAMYTYDGNGQRVMKQDYLSGRRTIYVSDLDGELLAEYESDGVEPACPTGGTNCRTAFVMTDHLGSTRAVTDALGNLISRKDYLPFGDVITNGRTGVSRYDAWGTTPQFTGEVRDAESGLDYLGARYLSGTQGRFTSPDAPLLDQRVGDPQSWNLYSYVRNNPLRFIDRTGMACVYVGPAGSTNAADLSNPSNYSTVGTDHGTCADVFSNDIPVNRAAQRVAEQVVRTAEGPVNVAGYGLIAFFQIFGARVMHEPTPQPVGGISQGRTLQDVQAGGRSTPTASSTGRIGTSPAQEAQLRSDIAAARAQGATDIRVNQAQVNAQGQLVGLNRPDLQYTLKGQRFYVEYERSASGRGFSHTQRIQSNDPSGIVEVKVIP